MIAELAAAGFLLSRIGEAQKHATSVKNRISKFRKNPGLFQVLSDSVDRLGERIKDVENIVKKYPGALPGDISGLFNGTFLNVCSTLEGAKSTMDKSLSRVFGPGASSRMRNKRLKGSQVMRANEFNDELKALKSNIDNSISLLHGLFGVLSNCVKAEENRAFVALKIDEVQMTVDENRTMLLSIMALRDMVDNAKEVYSPVINAPAPGHTVRLDFGNASTPEGLLKKSVLYGESSKNFTAAIGAMKPAYGVLGMAGVGEKPSRFKASRTMMT